MWAQVVAWQGKTAQFRKHLFDTKTVPSGLPGKLLVIFQGLAQTSPPPKPSPTHLG